MRKKVRTPSYLIGGFSPFDWNNLRETLLVAVYPSLTSRLSKVFPTPHFQLQDILVVLALAASILPKMPKKGPSYYQHMC